MSYTSYLRGFGGDFFSAMFAEMDARKKQLRKEELGITSVGGYEGIPRLNIPHKYHQIGIGGKYFTCKGGTTTIYNMDGKFILECEEFTYLKEGMFLVGKAIHKKPDPKQKGISERPNYAYALYNEENRLTEYIFKPYGMSEHFNEFGFIIVGLFGEFWKKAVINKLGEIVFESDSSESIYLRGIICSLKDKYINLLTGKLICEGGYHSLSTDEFLFQQTEPNCVYQISKNTGDFIIHGVSKPPKEEPKKAAEPIVKKKIESEPKKRRNDLCDCGSGKKYKFCCINKY